MFSANENLLLRQHKRRIVNYVEECIPEPVLDMGTSVMVMEVSCKSPLCVPLETVICIVFPRPLPPLGKPRPTTPPKQIELIPGVPESAGGTYKTKILKPMSSVEHEDVYDALPPEFPGGKRTMERLCMGARDVTLSQIEQIMGEEDVEGKTMMAEYLRSMLKEYIERGCKAPEIGEAWPEKKKEEEVTNAVRNDVLASKETDSSSSNFNTMNGKGNFIMKRVLDVPHSTTKSSNTSATSKLNTKVSEPNGTTAGTVSSSSAPNTIKPSTIQPSHSDWKQKQRMDAISSFSNFSSQNMIQQLSDREHAPGIRRAGCPCCDPDNPANIVDTMMML